MRWMRSRCGRCRCGGSTACRSAALCGPHSKPHSREGRSCRRVLGAVSLVARVHPSACAHSLAYTLPSRSGASVAGTSPRVLWCHIHQVGGATCGISPLPSRRLCLPPTRPFSQPLPFACLGHSPCTAELDPSHAPLLDKKWLVLGKEGPRMLVPASTVTPRPSVHASLTSARRVTMQP